MRGCPNGIRFIGARQPWMLKLISPICVLNITTHTSSSRYIAKAMIVTILPFFILLLFPGPGNSKAAHERRPYFLSADFALMY